MGPPVVKHEMIKILQLYFHFDQKGSFLYCLTQVVESTSSIFTKFAFSLHVAIAMIPITGGGGGGAKAPRL